MKKTFLPIALLLCLCLVPFVSAAEERFTPGSDAVFFVDNANGADTNAGTRADAPLQTLEAANAKLRETGGGTVVISGEVAITERYVPDPIGGAVVYTSLHGGVDYAKNGAKLVVGAGMAFCNDTYFEYIHLSMKLTACPISGRYHNFGFGYGVTVTNDSGVEAFEYPVLIGGYNSPVTDAATVENDYTVHVYSGTLAKVYGGNRRNKAAQTVSHLMGDIAVIIRGGSFRSSTAVETAGMNVCSGNVYLEISGGEFAGTVVAVSRLGTINETTVSVPDAEYTADVLVRISGGHFAKRFRLAQNDLKDTVLTYPPIGDATVEITGGEFDDYTVGYGMAGQVVLRYDPDVISVDRFAGFPIKTTVTGPAKTATETASFVNPISEYPDPYVMEKDGYYYYCFSGSGINVAMHGNIPFGTLSTQYRKVFTADMTDIEGAKKNYWAPEIHYFDEATVGKENAGWYIYFAADDGDGANHRMYALRASDPENPMSDYEMIGKVAPPTDICAIDGTVMVLGGKLYFVWSGWNDGATAYVQHSQDIYIAPMSDPFTICGERVRLSTPEYTWEKRGGGSVTSEGKVRPSVNEGPQILQEGGTTHIIYSASGSWTRYYCYGALTLIGTDPLNPDHWYKSAEPVFETGNGVYGPGHGTFVKDMQGDWWMYYHANPSTTVPEGSSWWAERQTYAKPFAFVQKTVGGKTVTYPDFGLPAAYQGAQTVLSRVTDYHAAGEHRFSPYYTYTSGNITELARHCYVCGAEDVGSVVFGAKPTLTLTPTADSVTVAWETYAGATSYSLYRKLPNGTSYDPLAALTLADTAYIDAGLASGTHYRYLMNVYYRDRAGETHYIATGGKAIYTLPAAPAIRLAQKDDGSISVSVTDAVTCAGYKYYRSANGGAWELIATTAETAVTDANVTPNVTYAYKACAYNENKADGAFSPEVQITADYEKPPFAESADGAVYDKIAARANGGAFTLLMRIRADADLSARLPYAKESDLPQGGYVYCVTGDFITLSKLAYADEGCYILQPSAESDAVVFSAVPLVLYGDANGDGALNLLDALRILRLTVNASAVCDVAAADMNGNLAVDIADALQVLHLILN